MSNEEFRALYDAYYDMVAGFVHYCAGRHGESDDIIQRIFIKVALGYPRFHHQSSTKTWILAIARNEIADFFRQRKRHEKLLLTDEMDDRLLGSAELTEDIVASADERDVVRSLVEALPFSMRTVVVLRVYHGLTSPEAGQVMGWPAVRVRVTYHRALKRLRKELTSRGIVPAMGATQAQVDTTR